MFKTKTLLIAGAVVLTAVLQANAQLDSITGSRGAIHASDSAGVTKRGASMAGIPSRGGPPEVISSIATVAFSKYPDAFPWQARVNGTGPSARAWELTARFNTQGAASRAG